MPKFVPRSRAAGTFEVAVTGSNPATNPPIAYGAQVIVKDAGTVIFIGKRIKAPRSAQGKKRGITMLFKDAWDDLTRCPYKQVWNLNGSTTKSSRVFLFQNITSGSPTTPWTQWTVGEQLEDIINYASEFGGVNIQLGTVDPLLMFPVTPMRDPKCAEAIIKCLQSVPDAITWMDYTTTLDDAPCPTLHIRQRQNCTPVTLPYSDGVKHFSTEIEDRPDLQVPQVFIDYQETDVSDGTSFTDFETDAYPIGTTADGVDDQPISIDLRGSTRNTATGTLSAIVFDPVDDDFWKGKKPDLAKSNVTIPGTGLVINTAINDGSANCITVKDSTGTNVDLDTYPNEYTGGVLAPWMIDGDGNPIKIIEATVTAVATYSVVDNISGFTTTHDFSAHPISTRIKLTNSPTGSTTYRADASASQAETPPPFLAYLFWCSVNNVAPVITDGVPVPPESAPALDAPPNLQWEGEHVIVEKTISTYYNCFNVLNLDDSDGGNSDWAEMNAAIYEVEYDFYAGKTTIRFGPHKHLSFGQFFEQTMMFRMRLAWENPNVRATAQDSSGAGTQIGKDTRLEDTSGSAAPTAQLHGVIGPIVGSGDTATYWAQHIDAGSSVGPFDGDAGRVIQIRKASDGTIVTDSHQVLEFMSDVYAIAEASELDEDVGVILRWRPIGYKTVDGCSGKWRVVFCSQEFDGDPPEDPNADD